MNKDLCTIAISVYKESPDHVELASFKQAIKILGKWRFILFCPKGLNIEKYKKIFEINKILYEIKFLDKEWFLSSRTYSSLLLQEKFWDLFSSKFVLIYQLDAWVFRDELEYWCKRNYDYIGAPNMEFWFAGNFSYCRNGGFSLRKVSSIKRSLKFLAKTNPRIKNKTIQNFCFDTFYKVFNSKSYDKMPNEDVYYSLIAPQLVKNYKVGNLKDSIKFSFEVGSDILYEKNDNKLPFGCHAFEKYEPDFWKNFIPIKMRSENFFFGHKINIKAKIPSDKNLYIWGASVEGRFIFRHLSSNGYKIKAFIDGNTALHNYKYYNCKILPFEKVVKKNAFIIIGSSKKRKEMAQCCREAGLIFENGI